jgi:hypothetical protein
MRLRLLSLISLMYASAAIAAPQAPAASLKQPAVQTSPSAVSRGVISAPAPSVPHWIPDPAHPTYTVDETPEKGGDRLFDDPNSFLIMLFTIVLGLAAIWQGQILSRQDIGDSLTVLNGNGGVLCLLCHLR